MGGAVLGEHQAQRFFGAGLAHRAGDGDDLRLRVCARAARKFAQAGKHIGDDEQRRVMGKAVAPIGRDHGKPGAAFERGRDEFVAIAVITGDGKECFARSQRAAVDRDAAYAGGQHSGALGAHCRRHRLRGPQRCHAAAPKFVMPGLVRPRAGHPRRAFFPRKT